MQTCLKPVWEPVGHVLIVSLHVENDVVRWVFSGWSNRQWSFYEKVITKFRHHWLIDWRHHSNLVGWHMWPRHMWPRHMWPRHMWPRLAYVTSVSSCGLSTDNLSDWLERSVKKFYFPFCWWYGERENYREFAWQKLQRLAWFSVADWTINNAVLMNDQPLSLGHNQV